MRRGLLFGAMLAGLGGALVAQPAARNESKFATYRGYSRLAYDGWARSSQYLTMRDGVRIAIDLYRPTKAGRVETTGLPVLWTHTPYYRSTIAGQRLASMPDYLPWIGEILRHGYVVAAVDARGTGASFGVVDGIFQPAEAGDAYEITEWLAAQPWSTGQIGMFGLSYLGITQLFAAGQAPPSLKAIMPEMAYFDLYDFVHQGGIFQYWAMFNWGASTQRNNIYGPLPADFRAIVARSARSLPGPFVRSKCQRLPCAPMGGGPVTPVDEDTTGNLLAAAQAEHLAGRNVFGVYQALPYRDSRTPSGVEMYRERGFAELAAAIARSGIAIYHVGGWYDGFTSSAFLAYQNIAGPRKLIVGPWFHPDQFGVDRVAEALRWFDHWLKGVDTGVMNDDPIHYWTIDAPAGKEWRSTKAWPLPAARATDYFFAADGALAATAQTGSDHYQVDLTTSLGRQNRWTATAGGSAGPVTDYPDLAANDRKALTYTTAPLPAAVEVTGHPVAHVWISADAPDVDVHAVLSEVSPTGRVEYVTEGRLRASHRALESAPYDRFGLPYHRSFQADVAPLGTGPAELVFDLHPTSKMFRAGHRIRVSLTGADQGNFETLVTATPPRLTVHRSAEHPSRIVLPIVP
jgi:predicted acyl esterase